MTVTLLDRADLGPLHEIAQGGQSTLYSVPEVRLSAEHTLIKGRHIVSAVYKEYHHPEHIDATELEARINFYESLDDDSKSKLLALSAWPLRTVQSHGSISGFITAEVPDQYRVLVSLPSGPRLRIAEIQYLLNSESFLANADLSITDRIRGEILRDVADALTFFHGNEIIVGDFSAKNLLYSASHRPKAFYLDCDSMRFRGRDIHPQLETVNWTLSDPEEPRGTAPADVYKLALLVLRLYSGSQNLRVLDGARLPASLVEVVRSSLLSEPELRPTASVWLDKIADVLARTNADESRGTSGNISAILPVWRTVTFTPAREVVDVAASVVEQLPRFSLGEPVILPLSSKRLQDDPDLDEYVRQSAGQWRFMVVKLSCSFYPNEEEPLLQAEVAATLRNEDPDGIQPIAWSVDPRFIVDSVQRSSASQAATGISLVGGSSYQRNSSFAAKEYFVQALGEHESDVVWVFRRTKSSSLTGAYTLTMIVRLPTTGHCLMQFRVLAYAQRRLLGIVPYRALIPRTVRSMRLDIQRRVSGERYPGDQWTG
jgi:hypothetical protein